MRTVRIKNFKCFTEQAIPMNNLTVLVGRNAVGKSSFIQACCLLGYSSSANYGVVPLTFNEVQDLHSVEEVLNFNADEHLIEISCDTDRAVFECDIDNKQLIFKKYIGDGAFACKYLSAERLGPRLATKINSEDPYDIGVFGQYSWGVLGKIKNENKTFDESDKRIFSDSSSSSILIKQIERWLQFIVSDTELRVTNYEEVDQAKVKYKSHNGEYLSSTNFGFGVTYALPVILMCLLAESDETLVIENPEAHLDPCGQSRMGQFLAQVVSSGVRVILETHSEHIINGVRLAILKDKLPCDNAVINFFSQENGIVEVKGIHLNEQAELAAWPTGFMDQEERDLAEIFKLQRARKKNV